MNPITLQQAAQWCGGQVDPQYGSVSFSGICYDTRKLVPGQLFVALSGAADGHLYIPKAMEQGAAAVLCRQAPGGVPAIVTEDPLKALGKIAAAHRESRELRVVGITGSVGKTTTKEMIAAILSTTYPTAKTAANHNNDIGLPVSILDIDRSKRVAVLEMGMNHFGEMSYLTSIAKPDIAVITNIGTMHIENLGSREGILQAKLEILEGLRQNSSVIFNGDEPLLWEQRNRGGIQPIYFGIENPACQVRAEQVHMETGGVSFEAVTGSGRFVVEIPAEGIHHVYDALAAIAVGELFRIPHEQMARALGCFENTGSRQKIYEKNGFTIIEDCYNAGPESMSAALEVLTAHKEGQRIAVLGDMLELGSSAAAEHYRVGRLAAAKADRLLVMGSHGKRYITGALTGGMSPKHAVCFENKQVLAAALKHAAKPGDTILFKGSRGMKMEQVLALFLEETAN